MSLSAIANAVLGTDRLQRIRLLQTGIAAMLSLASALAIGVLVWAGIAPAEPARWWTVVTLGGFALFLLLVRSGVNRRFREPSLSLPQMGFALLSAAWAYAIAGAGRGMVFPVPVVVLMFGMYALRPAAVARIAWAAVALFGVTMAAMAWSRPAVYDPQVELAHFCVLAAMLLAVGLLAGQLAGLRERVRVHKAELAQAQERIAGLATRDELTGLANRRSIMEVLRLEHQRCMRSGRSFCVAIIDIDHLAQVNRDLGHPAGDALVRAFAAEAAAAIRVSDVLARWGGDEFLLLMTDTRASLARLGVERLRERVAAMRLPRADTALAITFSAGVAEHRAGEPVTETIARADQAVHAAKAQGRNRLVMA